MRLPPFAIVRNGEPLSAIPLRNSVRTGIAYEDPRLDLGLIAEFEEREAATFVGIPWTDWITTDTQERAAMVAHYRMHHQVSLHSVDAVQRKQEQDKKREEARRKHAS